MFSLYDKFLHISNTQELESQCSRADPLNDRTGTGPCLGQYDSSHTCICTYLKSDKNVALKCTQSPFTLQREIKH